MPENSRGLAMKELWTGRVELLTPPSETGDTKCFTNVVAWADGQEGFTARVAAVFGRRGWSILRVEECRRVAESSGMVQELVEQVERASEIPEACIFGTLHYYPSRPL
jgi:hypothetical protein